MMKCKDIGNLDNDSPHHKNIWTKLDLTGTVEGMEKSFTTKLKVKCCHALLRDDSGITYLTLWEEDVDIVKNGDRIEITNGYMEKFNGKPRFMAGRGGVLRVLSKELPPIQVGVIRNE